MFVFFFNDTATTEIYTLSLHDALPIWTGTCVMSSSTSRSTRADQQERPVAMTRPGVGVSATTAFYGRSEEHTSELQSHSDLVCRLLLEKKKITLTPILRPRRRRVEGAH